MMSNDEKNLDGNIHKMHMHKIYFKYDKPLTFPHAVITL